MNKSAQLVQYFESHNLSYRMVGMTRHPCMTDDGRHTDARERTFDKYSEMFSKVREHVPPDKLIMVRYEELITRPDLVCTQLLNAFPELEYLNYNMSGKMDCASATCTATPTPRFCTRSYTVVQTVRACLRTYSTHAPLCLTQAVRARHSHHCFPGMFSGSHPHAPNVRRKHHHSKRFHALLGYIRSDVCSFRRRQCFRPSLTMLGSLGLQGGLVPNSTGSGS